MARSAGPVWAQGSRKGSDALFGNHRDTEGVKVILYFIYQCYQPQTQKRGASARFVANAHTGTH